MKLCIYQKMKNTVVVSMKIIDYVMNATFMFKNIMFSKGRPFTMTRWREHKLENRYHQKMLKLK